MLSSRQYRQAGIAMSLRIALKRRSASRLTCRIPGMVNRLFGSFREWALPARRRKESKSPSVDGVFAVHPACQETGSLWPGRDSSAAEIIRRPEPTGVEFVAEQRSSALSLAG